MYRLCLEERRKGTDSSNIRKMLLHKGISDEEIGLLFRRLENQMLKDKKIILQNKKSTSLIYMGLVVLIVSIVANLSIFNSVQTGNMVLFFGPPIVGFGMIITGLAGRRNFD